MYKLDFRATDILSRGKYDRYAYTVRDYSRDKIALKIMHVVLSLLLLGICLFSIYLFYLATIEGKIPTFISFIFSGLILILFFFEFPVAIRMIVNLFSGRKLSSSK